MDVGSKLMVKMYGEHLKVDIAQIAHHGWGGTTEWYRLLNPTVLLWPTDNPTFKSQTAGTSSGYYQKIDYAVANQKGVELIIVADGGHKTIYLPDLTLKEHEIDVWTPQR